VRAISCEGFRQSHAIKASKAFTNQRAQGLEWGTSPITRLRVLTPIGPMKTVNGEKAGNGRVMWTRDIGGRVLRGNEGAYSAAAASHRATTPPARDSQGAARAAAAPLYVQFTFTL